MSILNHKVIALEEHYSDREIADTFPPADRHGGKILDRLFDYNELRLAEMDEAGVDMQVLSQSAPSLQRLDGETAVRIATAANDRLAKIVEANPDRFAAFAALPTADPTGAAAELERSVTQLGFKGAMVHGLTNGLFLDDKQFWPIFERAQALDVPLYLHPASPDQAVVDRYYKDYVEDFPSILAATWGFTVETATQAIRLVLSGVFDKYPGLKIILGHMGEGLPFLMWRIDFTLKRMGNKVMERTYREYFSEHFWITTSGNFSNSALLCSVMEMGIDRIMFSIDYPFVDNNPGTDWIPNIPLCEEDKAKLLHGNVERLLKL
jgi:predicted TIM-barrel fold metal-dependent hydrolase